MQISFLLSSYMRSVLLQFHIVGKLISQERLYRQATRHAVRQEGLSAHSILAAPFPWGLSLFSPWEAVYAVAQ